MMFYTIVSTTVAILLLLALIVYPRASQAIKIAVFTRRYNDESIATLLANRNIWKGMTKEQLLSSWGRPSTRREYTYTSDDVKEYKYTKIRGNQFRARVTLENDVVVNWTPSNQLSVLQRLRLFLGKHQTGKNQQPNT